VQSKTGGIVIDKKGGVHNTKGQVNVNEQIRSRQVRAIDYDGEQLGVISLVEALSNARSRGFDLVEVAANADPPVCKIMDYGKYKYEMSKKAHLAKKKQVVIVVKEIKIRPKIDEHDYKFKVKHAIQFLSAGNKVKISIVFRGREMAYMEKGREILNRVAAEVEDVANVEYLPKVDKRTMFMILAPKKSAIKTKE